MNALLTASRGLQSIVDAPVWVVLLLKVTAILLIAWLAHLALARANPRWRVFLWRVTAVGLIVLPAAAWLLPALEIHVLQSPPIVEVAAVSTGSKALPADRAAPRHALIDSNVNPPDTRAERLLPASPNKRPEAISSSALPQAKTLAPTSPKSARIAWPALLFAGWLGGIAVLSFRLCLGHYRILAIARRAAPAAESVRRECMRVAEAIGCGHRVEVVQSGEVESPFLCGLRRPLLLLPARMREASYRKDLPGILAHELTHVRSHDVPWNAGLQLISVVLWFHPLVWRMRKAHLAACELVCDAVSASFVGDVIDYCRTLARVAVDACQSLPSTGIAMARSSSISRRLSLLKKKVFHLPLNRRSVIGFVFAALLAVACLSILHFAYAEPPPAQPAAAATDAKMEQSRETAASNLTCRVIDSKGVGVAKAKVAPQMQEGIPTWSATTDDQGRYSIPPLGLSVKSEMITITAPGYLSREIIRIGNRPASDIPLQKAASIEGHILGPDGKPLANAPLAIGIYSDFIGESGNYLHAISNDEGKFKIENIPPGVVVLYYPGATPSQYELESGRETKLLSPGEKWPAPPVKDAFGSVLIEAKDGEQISNLVMDLSQSTCGVEGRVVGPNGAALPGATVSAKRFCNNLSFKNLIVQLDAGDLSAKSDEEGRYKLEHLPPGEWSLSVWHPHFQRPGKSEYVTFSSGEQKKAQDLRVFERYESENVFPDRMAMENSATLADLLKQKYFTFEIPTMAQYPGSRQYRFAELTVNSVAGSRINVEPLNLPNDATPEQIAKAAHVGELYYVAPENLVTVNGTILAPCRLPEKKDPQEKPLSQLSRLTRAEIQELVETSLRKTPEADGRQIKVKKGDWYIAVRNDGRAFLINIDESLSKDFIRLLTYYIGQLDIGARPAENLAAAKPDGDATPAKTVHGKVEDENGKPIAGADVWMMPALAIDPVQKRPAAHDTSDTQGRFTVPVPPLADYNRQQPGAYPFGGLWAYAEGHQLSTGMAGDQIYGRDKSDVVLKLKPATDTAIVVLGPDGMPLEGTLVEPYFVRTMPFGGEAPDEVRSRIGVRTNADGRAILTALQRDALVSIRIVTADFGIQTQQLIGLGSITSDQPIRLRQGGRIEGRVTAEKPEMARGVRIILTTGTPRSYQPGGGPSMTNGYADVESDEQGTFLVPAMAAGRLCIEARVDPGLPVLARIPDFTKRAIDVHPGETTMLQIPLEAAVSVRGSVRAKDTGKPIPKSLIQVNYGVDPVQKDLVFSDAQGNFAASVLPGRIQLQVLGERDKYSQMGDGPQYEVPANVKEFQAPPLELVPSNAKNTKADKTPEDAQQKSEPAKAEKPPVALTIAVQAVDDVTGKPLADVPIVARAFQISTRKTDKISKKTDAEGNITFEIRGDTAKIGDLSIEARPAEYIPQYYDWTPNKPQASIPGQITMRFKKGITIGGQIQDSSGKPIADAKIELTMPATFADNRMHFHLGTLKSDKEGRWHCDVAPEDLSEVRISASHPDFIPGGSESTPAMKEQKHVLHLEQGALVRGQVLDAQGQPAKGMAVSLGQMWAEPNTPQAKTDAKGEFVLKNCPIGPSAVTVQGEGFAPQCQKFTVGKENQPLSFRLEPGATLRGRVVDQQGKPLEGIGVYADTWQDLRTLTFRSTTDREGRFVWKNAPRDAVIFNFSANGFRSDRNRPLTASDDEQTITLYPELLIRGTVVDEETGKPVDKFQYCSGFRRDTEDQSFFDNQFIPGENGRFEYHMEEASMPNNFVKVMAEGYNPAISRAFKPTEGQQSFEFKLKKGKGYGGVVLLPDGKPAQGATVALLSQSSHPFIENGVLSPNSSAIRTTTDAEGRFSFVPQTESCSFWALHQSGFGEISQYDLEKAGTIKLQLWGRLEGVVKIGNQIAKNVEVTYSSERFTNERGWYHQYETSTDDEGHFIFDRVYPSKGSAARVIVVDNGMFHPHAPTNPAPVVIVSGKTSKVEIGGKGRPVVGRIDTGGKITNWIDHGSLRPKYRMPDGFSDYYSFKIESDGSFRIDDVAAGKYELDLRITEPQRYNMSGIDAPAGFETQIGNVNYNFSVPEMPEGQDDDPLDLGTIKATLYKDFKPGDPAPAFTAETIDGNKFSLEEQQGKVVLIKFWASRQDPRQNNFPELKRVYERFHDNPKFVMIGLSQDQNKEIIERFVKKEAISWPQAMIGANYESGVAADYGVRFTPAVFLVGSDGKIIGKDLHGAELEAAVGKALKP